MAEHGFEYNKDVEAFREHEYPMLKGKWGQLVPSASELMLEARSYLSRPCGNRPVLEVTHGRLHG